jgi:ABC-type lipoprotein export system ATPase subunit
LINDERFTGADREVLLDLCGQGTAVVVVTHNLTLADQLPRRVHMLDGIVHADRRATEAM